MAIVLLVEDEPALRAVLSEYLAFCGYAVIAAADATEALGHADSTPLDVVVSDVLLPGMDGIELCASFRRHPRCAHVPFVFMTARNVDAQLREALDTCGDGSVLKPFEPTALVAVIESALRPFGRQSCGG
ncbi:MAG: response regulator [Candidatus Eremiobacteraeota bacterium]|nr:response regulator [Candidatus Eremiobacteraeota bacterium]